MPFPWNKYPYTDFHQLNDDWVIESIKELGESLENFITLNSLVFADPLQWDITTSYAVNTIVIDQNGDAYLSVKPVPDGVLLSNTDYWTEVFNFSNYIEKANKNLTDHYERNVTKASTNYDVDDWIVWDDVLYIVTAQILEGQSLIVGTNLTHFTVEDFLKDFITTVNSTILQYKNDIDASESAYRSQLAADIATTTATLTAQFNQAISAVTVDSEVLDARIGADGHTYDTLGNAIRSQIKQNNNQTLGAAFSSGLKTNNEWLVYNDRILQAYISDSGEILAANNNRYRVQCYYFDEDTAVVVRAIRTAAEAGAVGVIGFADDISQFAVGQTLSEVLYPKWSTIGTRTTIVYVPKGRILVLSQDWNTCQVWPSIGTSVMENLFYTRDNLLVESNIHKNAYYNGGSESSSDRYDYFVIPLEANENYYISPGARFITKITGSSLVPETRVPFTFTPDSTADYYITFHKDCGPMVVTKAVDTSQVIPYDVMKQAYNESWVKRCSYKKILNLGDSIAQTRSGAISYAYQLATRSAASLEDYATGGATISLNAGQSGFSSLLLQVQDVITNHGTEDYDIILVEGGANDFSANVAVGSVVGGPDYSPANYTATFDTTTSIGALEEIFKLLRTYYPHAIIVQVLPHKHSRYGSRWVNLMNGIRTVCAKWSVEIADVDKEGELNTRITSMITDYTDAGGTHPNTLGSYKFYLPLVINALEKHIVI